MLISTWLIWQHLSWYTNVSSLRMLVCLEGSISFDVLQKREQRCKPVPCNPGHPSHMHRYRAHLAYGSHICGDILRLVSILGESHTHWLRCITLIPCRITPPRCCSFATVTSPSSSHHSSICSSTTFRMIQKSRRRCFAGYVHRS